MKKTLKVIFSLVAIHLSIYAQETASGSEGKKMFAGLHGSYLMASVPNYGAGFSFEYFMMSKLSFGIEYTYGFSENRQSIKNSNAPLTVEASRAHNQKTYNHVHMFNLLARYYVLGGNDAKFGVFAGGGLGYTHVRSSLYTSDKSYGSWNGLYLVTDVGADIALGPGRAYIETGFNPRFAYFASYDIYTFPNQYFVNLGYKYGF